VDRIKHLQAKKMNGEMIKELELAPMEKRVESPSRFDSGTQQLDALSRVVDQIKADAHHQPKKYLEGAIVPAGGE
jgi:hypothetical protein